ncbi:YbaB/EbfC family nucleoid-associated protein [Solwaraspora sp. WMMD1047]|uniref:YbaB/EbfC family nucleoid-associated protein n=1 Tax=Solwaraspora sp. WMMD1047 TaxID=3016102 RepID=UPI002417B742|nr:YbaB/EbfC family nucleoid-associated protein [Solwaraspora sp. WMMD1047]MDG4833398.1 YbaB/EbfC family nucleoid-associated protein [Solwaraspora sp. WMMD1047]
MVGRNFAGAEQWITDWQETIEERARRASDVSDQMRDLTAYGEAESGAVRVTVDRRGNLMDLKLGDQVDGWSREQIVRAVLAANSAARTELADRVRRTLIAAGFDGDVR